MNYLEQAKHAELEIEKLKVELERQGYIIVGDEVISPDLVKPNRDK